MPEPPKISNDYVFRAPLEPHLYDGCDYDLYWRVVPGLGLTLVGLFVILRAHLSLFGLVALLVAGLFFVIRWYLRGLAKVDPLHRITHKRHTYYAPGYAPTRAFYSARRHPRIPPVPRNRV